MQGRFFCRDFSGIRAGLDLQAFSRAQASVAMRARIFRAKKFLPEL